MNTHRCVNAQKFRKAFLEHPLWNDQLQFPLATGGLVPCWFGFPFLIKHKVDSKKFTDDLIRHGIDTRPIVSGNMALQPAVKNFNIDLSMGPFQGAQVIHENGFFIGCHSKPLDDQRIYHLVTTILETVIENIG